MRFRQMCTVFALGLSLLMSSGCVHNRCCCRHKLFHRFRESRGCETCGCESCGCESSGYRPACECGMPVPMGPGVPVPMGAGMHVPMGPGMPVPSGTITPAPPIAPMPNATISTPSH
jgi:hypothetical protein